jgi:hypothetical protein
MRYLSEAALVDALAHWGAHEVQGRFRGQVPAGPASLRACLDFVMHARAPYISRACCCASRWPPGG